LHTWRTALDLIEKSPQDFLDQVRRYEEDDPAGSKYPRNKASDDATLVFAANPNGVKHVNGPLDQSPEAIEARRVRVAQFYKDLPAAKMPVKVPAY
jgi:hypothetical protein